MNIKKILIWALVIVGILLVLSMLTENGEEPPIILKDGQDTTKINTGGSEDSPFITLDGKELYFVYVTSDEWEMIMNQKIVITGPERPGHKGDSSISGDNYVSKRINSKWSVPKNLPFNTDYGECCPMTSYDGNAIYYTITSYNFKQSNDWSKNLSEDSYMISKNPDGTWGEPVNLKNINTEYDEINPHISKDSQTIYFESNKPGGYGGFDMYYSKKQTDGTWGEPVNMGSVINTNGDEQQAWISPDEKTIYFTKVTEDKIGIYKSVKDSGEWSTPEYIDLGLAAVGEPSLTEDEQLLYFASFDIEGGTFNIDILYSELQPDGSWGKPKPVD